MGVVWVYIAFSFCSCFLFPTKVFDVLSQKGMRHRVVYRILIEEILWVKFQVHTVQTYMDMTSDRDDHTRS